MALPPAGDEPASGGPRKAGSAPRQGRLPIPLNQYGGRTGLWNGYEQGEVEYALTKPEWEARAER